jgi:hypothetical protein
MKKLFTSLFLLIVSLAVDAQDKAHTVTFDLNDIINMSGASDLVNSDGEIVGKIMLRKSGLSMEDITVDKVDGIYQVSELHNRVISFNPSISKITDNGLGSYKWKRKSLPHNEIVWSNEKNCNYRLVTSIGKGNVVITMGENKDSALQGMLLFERIHNTRAILISNFTSF